MASAFPTDVATMQRDRGASCPLLSVGITTADWLQMGAELGRLERAGADFVHIDVMDGHFCPQLTVGPPVIRALRTSLRKDVHLMIEEPLSKVSSYVDAGADVITIHVEATSHPHRVLQELGSMRPAAGGARTITRGVAINPGTPVSAVEPLLDEADLILVLAVNPGLSGQRFGAGTEHRLAAVLEMIEGCGREVKLGVDGGVTRQNISSIAGMGVDLIVTGSAVFDGGDVEANMRHMLGALDRSSAG